MNLSDFGGVASPSDNSAAPKKLSDYGGAGDSVGGPQKTWQNDAGQLIDATTNRPVAPTPSALQSYTGSVLPFRRDEAGLHLAVPESIAALFRGASEAGARAVGKGETGQNPLRPLNPDEMSATMALGMRPLLAGQATPRVIPASAVAQDRALLAREARDIFKIPITAPQISGSTALKVGESAIRKIPLSGARAQERDLQQSWNRAVAQTFGEDAKTITPEVMDRAKRRIGGEINRIENATQVAVDDTFMNRLAEIESAAKAGLTDQEFGVVKRQLDGVLRNVLPGDKLEGTTYGNLLHRNSPLDQAAANANPNIARPATAIKAALQDALERSLSGDDLGAYRNARFQYKNMKTIEPLVNKAPTGDVSPALLNGRVSVQFPNRAYDTSKTNPLDRLAKIGQAFLKEPGTSNTTERRYAYDSLAKGTELAGAAALGSVAGLPAALGGAAATIGGGRLLGNYLRSPGLAEKTINRALVPQASRTTDFPSLVRLLSGLFPGALLGGQSPQEPALPPAPQ